MSFSISNRSILTLILTLLAACAEQPGTNNAYQENSTNCSQQFVSDYNEIAYKGQALSIDDLGSFETLVRNFSVKYKDVKCKAKVHSLDSLRSDDNEEMIDANAWTSKLLTKIASVQEEVKTAANNASRKKPTDSSALSLSELPGLVDPVTQDDLDFRKKF